MSRSCCITSIWSKYNNLRIDVLAPVTVVAASNIAIPSLKHVICSSRTPSRTSSWQQNSHPAMNANLACRSSRLDEAIRLNAYLCLPSTCGCVKSLLHYSEHVKKLQVFVLQVFRYGCAGRRERVDEWVMCSGIARVCAYFTSWSVVVREQIFVLASLSSSAV